MQFFKKDCVEIKNNDYKLLNIEELSEKDFVYLDPPYFNTTAVYNENGGWTEDNENGLYEFCKKLNTNGIRFGISNVFEHKGIKSQKLIDWCEKNNWNVYAFDKVTYSACGRGNSNVKEVFITNY